MSMMRFSTLWAIHGTRTAADEPEIDDLTRALEALPTGGGYIGLIHGDFELDNLRWPAAENGAIGMLDFDDCTCHWYAADIAFALRDLFDPLATPRTFAPSITPLHFRLPLMLTPVTQLQLDDVTIDVTFKRVKHLRLTIYPPDGRVRLSAPTRARPDAIRAFALSKLPWIKRHQLRFRTQAREIPPEHHALDDGHCRAQLRSAVPPLVEKWSALIGVTAQRVYFRRMKTLWGSCNPRARTIRLNTELARRSSDCLEYVIVHELTHFLEPSHNRRFKALMDQFLPSWTHYRKQLNQSPLPRP